MENSHSILPTTEVSKASENEFTIIQTLLTDDAVKFRSLKTPLEEICKLKFVKQMNILNIAID